MNLEQLKSGQWAKIVNIQAKGAIKKKLLILGFRPGKEIKMIKSAPLKDPLEVSLNNGHLSIRRSEAVQIDIELLFGETDES